MKAHELAQQLLAGPDLEVWVDDPIYEDEPKVVVGIVPTVGGNVVSLEVEEYTTPAQEAHEKEAAAQRQKKPMRKVSKEKVKSSAPVETDDSTRVVGPVPYRIKGGKIEEV